MEGSEGLYKRAYDLHYKKRDVIAAFPIYLDVVEKYPSSTECAYAEMQIKNIFEAGIDLSGLGDDLDRYDRLVGNLLEYQEEDRKAREAAEQEAFAQREIEIAKQKEFRSRGELQIIDLLKPFIGKTIGINVTKPSKPEPAILTEIQKDFFAVEKDAVVYHVPYHQVIRLLTPTSGHLKTGFFGRSFPLVVVIYDLVIYKGAVGFGMSLPLPDFD